MHFNYHSKSDDYIVESVHDAFNVGGRLIYKCIIFMSLSLYFKKA